MRRYVCKRDPSFSGCGKTYIAAAPVEELISEAILYRLDSPELHAALTGQGDTDDEAARLRQQIVDDQEQLEELASLYANREITAREWKAARDPIEQRIRRAGQALFQLSNTTVLAGYVGNSAALRDQWHHLSLDRQHAIVAAVLDYAIVGPPTRRGRFDPDRVTPVWRL